MDLSDLPSELLLEIPRYLDYEIDISSLARTNHRLYATLNDYLYERLRKHTANRALEWAARQGKPTCVSRLLAEGLSARLLGDDDFSPFELAVNGGHADAVKAFLDYDVSLLEDYQELSESNENLDEPRDVLLSAIEQGHEAVVRVLIDFGADIERDSDSEERKPLALATWHRHVPIVKLLIQSGCSPQDCLWGIWSPPIAESLAPIGDCKIYPKPSMKEFLLFLIDMGVDPEFRGENTRLWVFEQALCNGNAALVEFLLEKGIRPDQSDLEDLVAQLFVAAVRYPDITVLLPKLVDIDDIMLPGMPIRDFGHLIHGIVMDGAVEPMQHALHRVKTRAAAGIYKEKLESALFTALQYGRLEMIKLLLEHGVVSNGRDYMRLFKLAVSLKQNEIAELFFDKRPEPFPGEYASLLYSTLGSGNWQMAQWLCDRILLRREAQVTRSTSLLRCVQDGRESIQGTLPILRIFLELGSKVRTLDQRKAFLRAAYSAKGGILEVFLDAGFDVNATQSFICRSEYPCNLQAPPIFTALAYAASAEDRDAAEEAVEFLLTRGATFNIPACPSSTFRSSLQTLAYCRYHMPGYMPSFPELDDKARCRAARLLLRKGANPYERGPMARTPLENAALCNFLEMARILIDFFEETQAPFHLVEGQIWDAIATHHDEPDMVHLDQDSTDAAGPSQSETIRFLYRYYWRKKYPPPQGP